MLENPHTTPREGRDANASRTRRLISVAALVLLAVTQLVIYEERGWNAGLILLAMLIATGLNWSYRRRE